VTGAGGAWGGGGGGGGGSKTGGLGVASHCTIALQHNIQVRAHRLPARGAGLAGTRFLLPGLAAGPAVRTS